MKAAVHVALGALGLFGCGGAPPSRPATSEVVVPEEKDPPTEEGPGSNDSTPPATSRGGDLEACVRSLRDGEGVQSNEGQELYSQALGAERASDLMNARKTYYNLIQNHPKSGLLPLTYLAFGELFRAEAEADPSKLALAEQAYREVVKYPPPANTAYAYAWLRMGDVQSKSDGPAALTAYKKAVEASQQYPNLPCGQVIASDAKNKLASVYSEHGQASKAYPFFRTIAGDEGAPDMMRELITIYQQKNKPIEACDAAQSASNLPELAREACKKR